MLLGSDIFIRVHCRSATRESSLAKCNKRGIVTQKVSYDSVSILCQSGAIVADTEAIDRERWVRETVTAFQSLLVNLSGYDTASIPSLDSGCLTSSIFPCQKDGTEPHCLGWATLSEGALFTPQSTTPCPCAHGRNHHLLSMIYVAQELTGEHEPIARYRTFRPAAFRICPTDSGLRTQLMLWLHWGALRNAASTDDTRWLDTLAEVDLKPAQRLTLRWWARMFELNRLCKNSLFTVLTRTGIETLYRNGQMMSLSRLFDQLQLNDQSLVLLHMNGPELGRSTHQSNRLEWFESFLCMMDERGLGLAVHSKHPLFEVQGDSPAGSGRQGFRWRPERPSGANVTSFERLLRRGGWDRMIELLARGDFLLSSML